MRARLRTKRGLAYVAGGGLVVVVGALAAAYFLLFPTSSPKRFSVTTPAAAAGSSATTPARAGVAGAWTIGTGSKAGYRVREKLAFLAAQNDAVGRTSQITGGATLKQSGTTVTVTAASFGIDVSTLPSDKAQRDQRIHSIGLESDQYPTATFKLTKSITLPSGATSGKVLKMPATGAFTIHGTTKTETVPLQLSLTPSRSKPSAPSPSPGPSSA
ncbi:MAG: putative secreted protein [Conexibacter sp.]|nr:putative secreted protein [Conexibacter sp.]